MLKRFNLYLDRRSWKDLEKIGRSKGLKPSQLIRMMIAEFIERQRKTGETYATEKEPRS